MDGYIIMVIGDGHAIKRGLRAMEKDHSLIFRLLAIRSREDSYTTSKGSQLRGKLDP